MRTDLVLEPWTINNASALWHDDFLESIFFTGNGRMGIRGYLPYELEERGIAKGLYLAGIFGEIKPGITDLVNLPTPVFEKILINNNQTKLSSEIIRKLNMKDGKLTVSFTLAEIGNESCKVEVTYERFFPLSLPSIIVQRTTYHAKEDVDISLSSGISLDSCNNPVPDDQTKSNSEIIKLATLTDLTMEKGYFKCDFDILGTGLKVSELIDQKVECSGLTENLTPKKNESSVFQTFSFSLKKEEECSLYKLAFITTSRDIDNRISKYSSDLTYKELLSVAESDWKKVWDKCDFSLPAFCDKYAKNVCPQDKDSEIVCALRYNMFNLITSCSSHDPSVSIGARGLTHGRYKGCYFWDTDIFMLPFFIENDLTAAKSLLSYRVSMLPAAKQNSKKMNTKGARYPWMSSLDGSEQCESWDIGCSEIHITADIAYAMDLYHQASKDEEFYLDKECEVYFETARFWASRYTWNHDHTVANLLFCKGPDEYCGITNNNLFTNVMVRHNLELALKAAKDLLSNRPDIYSRLCITEEECNELKKLHDAIILPYDPITGHLTTDETFHLLEPVDISTIKADASASYHTTCFDRLQRYKVVKQADVLLIMTRLPKLFTTSQKETAWKDFEPLCLHDSTLSFASHALFALQNNIFEKGYEYLKTALLLDLRDIMGNTGHEGLHLASMGEAWQAAFTCKTA